MNIKFCVKEFRHSFSHFVKKWKASCENRSVVLRTVVLRLVISYGYIAWWVALNGMYIARQRLGISRNLATLFPTRVKWEIGDVFQDYNTDGLRMNCTVGVEVFSDVYNIRG